MDCLIRERDTPTVRHDAGGGVAYISAVLQGEGGGGGVVSYFLCVGRAHKSGPIITRCCRALQLAALSPVCWPIYPKASINGAVNSVAASLVPVRFGSVRDTSASIRSDTHKIILRTRGHHESGMRLELVTISRRTFAPTYETLRSL